MDKLTANIHWLGHDSFRIDREGVVLYIDPYRLKEGPKADLILITHGHSDHASMSDVALIQKQDTVIVTIKAAAQKLSGQITTVLPGEELTEKGVLIKTLPAYNLTKFRSPGVPSKAAIPMHVGEGIGSLADAERFKKKAPVPVVVKPIEKYSRSISACVQIEATIASGCRQTAGRPSESCRLRWNHVPQKVR